MYSIINIKTNEVLSTGLTDFDVDFLMYRKNHITNKDLAVIKDCEIIIIDKKIYCKNKPEILYLNY